MPIDTQAPDIPQDTTVPEPADEITIEQPDTNTGNTGPIVPPVFPIVSTTFPPTVVVDFPLPDIPIEIPDIFVPNTSDWRNMRLDLNMEGEFGWGDPLAQSFLCEASGGMMLTSIDLFFQAKSTHMPVSVEIRNMVNGYPGQIVLPFSVKTLNPDAVNISEDGSAATTFTFDSPVFVNDNEEFCFVVYSNSNDYECFISRMGEPDLITGETISGQPYAGSLFLSQNASTWTAEQTDDLKFDMKIAQFDNTKAAGLYFENEDIPVSKLAKNPIQTTASSNTVKVSSYLHGFYDTSSNSKIKGVKGDRIGSVLETDTPTLAGSPSDGTYSNQTQNSTTGSGTGLKVDITIASGAVSDVRIVDPGQGHAAGDDVTFDNFTSTHDLTVNVKTVGETLGGLPVDAIGGASFVSYSAVSDIGIDSYNVAVDLSSYIGTNKLKTGYTALESTIGGGENVEADRNYYYDTLHTMIPSIQRGGARILCSTESTAMKSPEGHIATGDTAYVRRSQNNFITMNDNSFLDNPGIVASPLNETNEMSSVRSFRLLLQMYTTSTTVSPVIDVGTIGCIAVANRVNNINSSSDVPTGVTYSASTEPEGDNNAFVYVTRKVNLKTPATTLKVIADNFRPPNTDLKYMFKIIKADENTPLDDIGFEYFNTTGAPDKAIEVDQRNFKEYEYTVEDLPEFTAFVVKIVGQGNNTCVVPAVSALRCMALA